LHQASRLTMVRRVIEKDSHESTLKKKKKMGPGYKPPTSAGALAQYIGKKISRVFLAAGNRFRGGKTSCQKQNEECSSLASVGGKKF